MQKKFYCFKLSVFYFLVFSYFLIPYNTSALTITSTENVSISAIVEGTSPPPPPGGGGGVFIPNTSVRFSGEAYPFATVTILKNGENILSVKADSGGLFSATLEEKYDKTILYSLFAKDIKNIRSLLINYPLVITSGYLTHLSGIRFPPTVTVDKVEVRENDYLTVQGYALPKKEIQVTIEDKDKKSTTFSLTSKNNGQYSTILPLFNLPKGNYSLYVKYIADDKKSILVNFIIGDTNIESIDTSLNLPGDCNSDNIINLVDFSVLAFWYKKPNPPVCVDTNRDKIVDLTDFSILAFYWTS